MIFLLQDVPVGWTSCCNRTLCEFDFHIELGNDLFLLLATGVTADGYLIERLKAQGLPFGLSSNLRVEYVTQNYVLGCLAMFEESIKYWTDLPRLCH